MAQFIDGPMIGPEALAAGMPPVGTPGTSKEIYLDSSQARAIYLEALATATAPGEPPVTMTSLGEPSAELMEPPTAAESPIDEALLRAAASGQPLTPQLLARLPSPTQKFITPADPPLAFTAPFPVPVRPAALNLTGLTVRVGRGIVATVSFQGGEPQAKNWARLLKFIEIAAEEMDDDGPATEGGQTDQAPAPQGPRGAAADLRSGVGGTGEPGLP